MSTNNSNYMKKTISLTQTYNIDQVRRMSCLRLGYTESTLLLCYWLDSHCENENGCLKSENSLIVNWLCRTSGYYDMNSKPEEILSSQTLNDYLSNLLRIVKASEYQVMFHFHNLPRCQQRSKKFYDFIEHSSKQPRISFYDFVNNKHILIVNNLGCLMKQQYESGNLQKANKAFPTTVKSIQYFENGYTFFNKGPHNNILETTQDICNKIKDFEFDGAIISAGAYSCLVADFIQNEMRKDVFVVGGDLGTWFGIKTKRASAFNPNLINEYFIEVPDHLKPEGYKDIEDGAYW